MLSPLEQHQGGRCGQNRVTWEDSGEPGGLEAPQAGLQGALWEPSKECSFYTHRHGKL